MCHSNKQHPNQQPYNNHVNQISDVHESNGDTSYIQNTNHNVPPPDETPQNQESEYQDIFLYKIGEKNLPLHKIVINDTSGINVLIDSGSSINILDETTYHSLSPKPALSKSYSRIYPYQASEPVPTLGTFSATVSACNHSIQTNFVVVKGTAGSLLGRTTAEKLNLLRIGPRSGNDFMNIVGDTYSNQIVQTHKELFKGVGKLKNFELTLHIDNDIPPKKQPIRRIPYHTKTKVSEELTRLKSLDIIEPVDGPTTWLNPIVVIPKKDGKIRLCLDMGKANEAIIRERHVIPKIEDIITDLHKATNFSKIFARDIIKLH